MSEKETPKNQESQSAEGSQSSPHEQSAPKRKGPSKKTVVISSIVAAVAIGTGVGVTYAMFSHLLIPNTVIEGDYNALEDDQDALMERYEASNGDYSSFKPYELLNVAINNFDASENHYSTVTGSVKASIATQTINGTYIRNGNTYFNESLSTSSFVETGRRFYQEGGTVEVYTGSEVTASSASWSENDKVTQTLEENEDTWGKTLDRSSIYIVSSKTVLNSESSVNEEGNYEVTVNLDPELSTLRYLIQMVEMSGLSEKPKFHSVELNFTLSPDLKPLSSVINENYDVTVGLKVNSDATLYTDYHTDEVKEIPNLDTPIAYEN